MLYRAIDHDAVDAGEADFDHYFCSLECAEQAGYKEEDCEEMPLEEAGDALYICENCECAIDIEEEE